MGNIIKILILVAIGYGIYWVYENVDFSSLMSDSRAKIKQGKTIQRVTNGRQRSHDDAWNIAK